MTTTIAQKLRVCASPCNPLTAGPCLLKAAASEIDELQAENARLRDLVTKFQNGGTTRLGSDETPVEHIHD